MNKKMYSIVLGAILLIGFFLPYFSLFGFNMSGLKMATAEGGDWQQYLLFLIPLSGLMLLVGGLNNGNYPLGRGLWTALPLLTILFMVIGSPLIKGREFGEIFESLGKGYGIGLWLTIAASIAALVYNPKN